MCLKDSAVEQSQCCLCWQGQIGFQFALAGEWGRRWPVTFRGLDPSSIVNWVTLLPPASMYIEEDFHVLAWVHKFLEPSSGFPVCRNTFGIKKARNKCRLSFCYQRASQGDHEKCGNARLHFASWNILWPCLTSFQAVCPLHLILCC